MVLNLIMSSSSAVFFAMRTYTLHSHNKGILVVTLLLCLTTSIFHAYAYFSAGAVYYNPAFEVPYWVPFCGMELMVSWRAYTSWMIASRITTITADTLVLALTLKKALDVKRRAGSTASMQSLSMLDFVVRHGVLYFSLVPLSIRRP